MILSSHKKPHKMKKNTNKPNYFDNFLQKSSWLQYCHQTQELVEIPCGLVVIPCEGSTWPIVTDQKIAFYCTRVPTRIASPSSSPKRRDAAFLIKLFLQKTWSPVNPLHFSALGDKLCLSSVFWPVPSTQPDLTNSRTRGCIRYCDTRGSWAARSAHVFQRHCIGASNSIFKKDSRLCWLLSSLQA